MTKKIGVENFRIFKEYTEFEIRPITLLTGPNNSGKSSLTKLMLLLQDGIESLNFQAGLHNLESFDKIRSWKDNKHFIKVKLSKGSPFFGDNFDTTLTYKNGQITGIELDNNTENLFSIDLSETVAKRNNNNTLIPETNVSVFFNHELYIKFILSKQFHVLSHKEENNQQEVEYTSFQKVNLLNDRTINLIKLASTDDKQNRTLAEIYDIRNEALNNGLNDRIYKGDKNLYIGWIYQDGKGPKIIDPKELAETERKIFRNLKFTINHSSEPGLSASLISIILEKVRGKVIQELTDYYIKKYPTIEIKENILGRIIFDQKLFDTSRKHQVDFQTTMFEEFRHLIQPLKYHTGFCHYISPQRGNQKRVLMNHSENDIDQIVVEYSRLKDPKTEFLKKIFRILEIEGEFLVERHQNYISVVSLKQDGQKITLADLGYGYSQIIPIVLKIIIIMNKSSDHQNFIIEEPEANLHPNLQSKLADVLALSKKYFPKLDFIIETHSEYLIRKLQFLTAKGQLETHDSIIYYFNSDKYVTAKEHKVKKIEITETGNLTDSFGKGFFDEVTQLQFDLMKVNMEQIN